MYKILIIPFMLSSFITTWAQFEEKGDQKDTLKTSYLEEVVISAGKAAEMRRYVAQQIKIISPSTIINLNAQNSADLLANTGVVAVQKSQQGGGSPILRGFEASRVLLVVDGIRMNNLIYRAGHLQNVITVDNNVLDRAEVLFGPASTVYGSDALGGAIHFFTKNPELRSSDNGFFKGSSFLRVGTVNNERTLHTNFNLAGKKIASLSSITVSDFGDLRMGKRINPALGEEFGLRRVLVRRDEGNLTDRLITNDDPYVQRSSGYQQLDLMQKILYKPSDRSSHLLNIQYSTSTDVPRYDRLTDPATSNDPRFTTGLKFSEWYYGPQKRFLAAHRFDHQIQKSWADDVSVTTSYQQIEESRFQRRFNNYGLQRRIESVDVAALTVDFHKKSDRNDFRYGVDFQFNSVTSRASTKNIVTKQITPLDTRYPGGINTMNFAAAWFTHTKKISPHFTLNDGFRVGWSSLFAEFTDKTFFPFPFDEVTQNNFISSASAGVVYTPDNWKVSLLTGTGFRAPNIDDLAKVFESVAGSGEEPGILIIPNPDLKPEKTVNVDFSVMRLLGSLGRIEGTFFVTQLFDAIVTLPFSLDGSTTVAYNGAQAQVYANQNRSRGLIRGATFQFKADLDDFWSFSGSWNYTRGTTELTGVNRQTRSPLDHIPPSFGRAAIQYNSRKVKGEFYSVFNGWKRLEDYSSSGEDNLQYATSKGMPSWVTFNLRTSFDFSKRILCQFGIDNIFDLQHRTFASGINAPGRNFFVTVRVKY
jgi:hemoglobin/transferrin/lactoferrin receptor protein